MPLSLGSACVDAEQSVKETDARKRVKQGEKPQQPNKAPIGFKNKKQRQQENAEQEAQGTIQTAKIFHTIPPRNRTCM